MQSSKNNYLIVLMTHKWGSRIEAMYDDFKSIHDTIILTDEAYKNEYNFPEESIFFNKNDFELAKYKGKYKTFINNFNPFFMIYDKLIEYDYVYMVEYDVAYFGNWKNFFDEIDNLSEDLILSTLRSNHPSIKNINPSQAALNPYNFYPSKEAEEEGYNYIVKDYSKIDKKLLNNLPQEYYSIGLHCLSRYSNKLIRFLKEEMPHYREFFEMLTPTLAIYNGFSVTGLDLYNPKLLATFAARAWPKMTPDCINKLFHPIKTPHKYTDWLEKKEDIVKILDKNVYNMSEELLQNIIIDSLLNLWQDNHAHDCEVRKIIHKYNLYFFTKDKRLIFKDILSMYIHEKCDDFILISIMYLLKTGVCTHFYIPHIISLLQSDNKLNTGIYMTFIILLMNCFYNKRTQTDDFIFLNQKLNKLYEELKVCDKESICRILSYSKDYIPNIHNDNIQNLYNKYKTEIERYTISNKSNLNIKSIEDSRDLLDFLDLQILTDYKLYAL